MTKKQLESIERERVVNELKDFLQRSGNHKPIIYSITLKQFMNINGNRRHQARYWIINNGHQWHITHHISLLNYGRYKGFTAHIGGYAQEAIGTVSKILFNDERAIEPRELNA